MVVWLADFQIQCDQATPRCSRCERLNLDCIGAGVQRFKFKSHTVTPVDPTHSRTISPEDSTALGVELVSMPKGPVDHLLGQLMCITSSTTNLRYNFVYAYGDFLLKIPQHLGINEALDASTNAVISAYTGFCRGEKAVSSRTLLLYSRALAALRHCLDDAEMACSAETLSAVMILMICQVSKCNRMDRAAADMVRTSLVHRGNDGPPTVRGQYRY